MNVCQGTLLLSMVTTLSLTSLLHSLHAEAADYFNPHAIELDGPLQETVDLNRFANVGGQVPGTYRVDIYVNGKRIETREVNFVVQGEQLRPQLTLAELKKIGVRLNACSALKDLPMSTVITDLGAYIPDATSVMLFDKQRLNLSIPHAVLDSEANDYVDPALWSQGLPALILNYGYSGSNTWSDRHAENTRSSFLNLRSGLNLGAWRLRNYSTYSDDGHRSKQWSSIHTYAQRDIQSLKSQFTLGESYTPSEVFDSFQFKGVQLASDENMLPESQRGFAPVIRGIAESNAQVTVRQNGYIIYQTYVAPGAFAISDLYPTSSSGDLEVTIKETNGNERRFIQPFSAVPNMVREGQIKYSLTAGRFSSQLEGASTPTFAQSSLTYGLPLSTTVYGGLLGSENYNSVALGISHGFGDLGSLSFDITQARTELSDSTNHKGDSYRVQYAKDIIQTGTSFTLAGYRYATEGFYDFQEANEVNADYLSTQHARYNKRHKTQLSVNQSLAGYGSFYISGYQQDYWGQAGRERSVSTGYNVSRGGINYNLNYSYTESAGSNRNDQQMSFSVQVPFDKVLPNSWATYSYANSKQGDTSQQIGLSGTALADKNLNYNVQQSHSENYGSSGNMATNYKGAYGEASAGYSSGNGTEQINYGAEGAVLVHPYGVTFSQSLGDSAALVRAPGAKHVKVENSTGVYTDWRGYAVVPYVSAYRKNRIALDTQSLGDNVDLESTTQTVIPTQGAVVLANFVTHVGSRVMMNLNYKGRSVPFGATATVVEADPQAVSNSSIVGGYGEVYLSGVPDRGRLNVQWGAAVDQQCIVDFVLPSIASVEDSVWQVLTMKAECR